MRVGGIFRALLSAALFIAGFYLLLSAMEQEFEFVSSNSALELLQEIFSGKIERVSERVFVFTLAAWMLCAAAGFLAVFFTQFGVLLTLQIYRATRILRSAENRKGFTERYDDIRTKLAEHPVIGNAWLEFDETLVKPDVNEKQNVIQNTVRPSVFLNPELVRGKSFALKMMPSIPGYFVGAGLLLTFIGLVLALDKAGTAVSSDSAKEMQDATRKLLEVASFKFATSIAGLGSSILLGIAFRSIGIIIENAFARLCEEAERMLLYRSPQSISLEMAASLGEQRDLLKDITQGDFFERFGHEFQPRLQNAVSTAMAPVVSGIENAVGELSNASKTGTEDLIGKFTNSLHEGAGAEMRDLAEAMQAIQGNLSTLQDVMSQTGKSFGGDMEKASTVLNEALAKAAETASERLDETMGGVLSNLEGHVMALTTAMISAKEAMSEQSKAQASSAASIRRISDALSNTAANVEKASDPLLKSSNRMSMAVEKMEATIKESAVALEAEKIAASKLADTISGRMEDLQSLWEGYAERFEAIDGELGSALKVLAESTQEQSERVQEYASKVDNSMAGAVDKLNSLLGGLSENASDFSESVEELSRVLELRETE